MKQIILTIAGIAAALALNAGTASAQSQQKERSAADIATEEAERLATLLDLEGWQVFYVDSTLQHDYTKLQEELRSLQESKVGNMEIYMDARDKWHDKVDAALKTYLTEEQWAKYLKSGAAKLQKDRAKRAQKRMK